MVKMQSEIFQVKFLKHLTWYRTPQAMTVMAGDLGVIWVDMLKGGIFT